MPAMTFLNGFPTQHNHFEAIFNTLVIGGIFGPHLTNNQETIRNFNSAITYMI